MWSAFKKEKGEGYHKIVHDKKQHQIVPWWFLAYFLSLEMTHIESISVDISLFDKSRNFCQCICFESIKKSFWLLWC